jgi:lipoprotein signal peptidase
MKIILNEKEVFELRVFHVLVLAVLVGVNLALSIFIQRSGFYYVANTTHWLFGMGFLASAAVLSLIISTLYFLRLSNFLMMVSVVIMSGAISNFVEKFVVFGSVTDYVPARFLNYNFGFFNIADIQIWVGLVMLNVGIFLGNKIPLINQNQVEVEETG